MPVSIGAKPEHGFDEPLGLLSDCHRRIERFLDVLLAVATARRGGALEPGEVAALETALRYFRDAAPRHTADEEESLFPRLRARAETDPAARAALAQLDALEADHANADVGHAAVDALGRRWLADGRLDAADADRLAALLRDLREVYRRHIAVEDEEIFPVAARALPAKLLGEVGQEMARRRGVEPRRVEAGPVGPRRPADGEGR
jgi:hemerythrin-like domain-containing protein